MSRDEAAEHFVDIIFKGALNPCLLSVKKSLETGMPKRLYSDLSQWYLGLSEQDKEMVIAVNGRAMRSVLYSLLLILDRLAGSSNADGKVTGFGLYVETFADKTKFVDGEVEDQIRVNPFDQHEAFLNDIFQLRVDEEEHNRPLA